MSDAGGHSATQLDLVGGDVATPCPPLSGRISTSRSLPDPDRFDWCNDESVIIPEQPETALYWNPQDQLVIRQRKWPDEDSFVFFSRAHVRQVIDALSMEVDS
jgi:hypothetical protein